MRSILRAGSMYAILPFAVGCGGMMAETSVPASANAPYAAQPAALPLAPAVSDPVYYVSPLGASAYYWHREGDYAVYRFSGKSRKQPVTLSERVVAVQGENAVIDLSFTEAGHETAIRVLVGNAPGTNHEVYRAAMLEHGFERPVPVGLYETLMEKTSFAADQNLGLFSSEEVTVATNGDALSCHRQNYVVTVGRKQAFLSVTESTTSPGTELSGEVKAMDGSVLYRAELTELGNSSDHTVALARR